MWNYFRGNVTANRLNNWNSAATVSLLICSLVFLTNSWVLCRTCFKAPEPPSGWAHVNMKPFQSQQMWWEAEALWVREDYSSRSLSLSSHPFISFSVFHHLSTTSFPRSLWRAAMFMPLAGHGWQMARHWAAWNRTGPIHYRDSRLFLIFNLSLPGGGLRERAVDIWTKTLFALDVLWHFEFSCAV